MGSADHRLSGIALSWLMTRGSERLGTRRELEDALRPFVEHQLSRAEWKLRFETLLEALLGGGTVAARGRSSLELTPTGRTEVLRFLQLEQPPRGLTWKKLKATHLVARSLDLPPSKAVVARMKDADGVRAAALQRQHGLDTEDTLTLAQTRDRLLWRQLGVETDRPFTLRAVQAHLLGQLLDAKTTDPRKGVEQLAARAAGAPRVDAEAVRLSLMRRWAVAREDGASEKKGAARASTPPVEPAPHPQATRSAATPPAPASTSSGAGAATQGAAPEETEVPRLSDERGDAKTDAPPSPSAFAERVLSVARALPTGRFGANKVFISHVWKALQPEWSTREAFDAALLEANRTRQLSLTRADLVSAMDPKDVAESEVRSFGASFHFVVV
ncbi:hypothetical protein HV824_22705 [Myxococcus sp. AM009]|uniref:hypothetical protein n=1 Tax=unclassified Myxococcus TaxID=2648731 RepID=UPI001596185F|nr:MULTISPECIES: hypothetical protein [unclassified Myxococcus]NVJ00907.1 hypothetical protein [Myxococcus sp. AM009]NVJ14157.1 hypothetical protein [Myxococcus sp. AM010]